MMQDTEIKKYHEEKNKKPNPNVPKLNRTKSFNRASEIRNKERFMMHGAIYISCILHLATCIF
jgi:hypothetical protein